MTTYKLMNHDGDLCVAMTSPLDDSPELVTNLYRIKNVRTRHFIAYHVGHDHDLLAPENWPKTLDTFTVEPTPLPGEYVIRCPKGYGTYLMLEHGGQARPVHGFTTEARRPKTQLPTRWRDGRWEKQTAKGWRAA